MNHFANVKLVASRDFVARVRSKSFVYGTIATLVVIAFYVTFINLLDDGDQPTRVAFTRDSSDLVQPATETASATGTKLDTRVIDDVQVGTHDLDEGHLDAVVSRSSDHYLVQVKSDDGGPTVVLLRSTIEARSTEAQLSAAGIDVDSVKASAANAARSVEVQALEPKDPKSGERLALGLSISTALYLAVLVFGVAVAQGVVEEKSNRVVEILMSTYRPWHILFGKILGTGTAGLLQASIIFGASLGAAIATDALDLGGELAGTVAVAMLWFLMGFFLYSTMLASAAALVSRQEEVNGVTQPIIMLLAVPYVLAISLLQSDPDGTVATVMSVIPLFAPVLMPARFAIGNAPIWQVALSFALASVVLAFLVWLASRIYANAALRMGARVKLRDALAR